MSEVLHIGYIFMIFIPVILVFLSAFFRGIKAINGELSGNFLKDDWMAIIGMVWLFIDIIIIIIQTNTIIMW